jgi:hypothetical protein
MAPQGIKVSPVRSFRGQVGSSESWSAHERTYPPIDWVIFSTSIA